MPRRCRFSLLFYALPVLGLSLLQGVQAQSPEAYKSSIDKWQAERESFLRSPVSWLNLEGLFWLKPGENSFGRSTSNDISYEHPDMPAFAGIFTWEGNLVRWQSAPGLPVMLENRITDTTSLSAIGLINGPMVRLGAFCWNIIKREEKIGVRFRNLNSVAVLSFKGISRYGTDLKWKIPATLVPNEQGGIAITNVLGQTNQEKSPGKLRFMIAGKNYTLDALDEGGDELFIIFGDATNQEETYPSGRFVYVKKPGSDGHTEIDFNKAINPPCAFTDFATCPLPPIQNQLPVAVTAGEKNFSARAK